MLRLHLLLASLAVAVVSGQEKACPVAAACDPATCVLPDCACSLTQPDVPLENRPQIVYLTFDDAFQQLTEENYYRGLFDGTFTNPNGCPIRATHFLTHQSTDYYEVNKYYNMGHEMASHSITHRFDQDYWRDLDQAGWNDEIGGMKSMINKYSGVPLEEIRGMRAPYLQGGADTMIEMLKNQSFEYDCTSPTRQYGYLNLENGAWPYTYDYLSNMDCSIQPCPECSHPGVWAQPMLDLEDSWFGALGDPDVGAPCDMVDSCIIFGEEGVEDSFEMLWRNFNRSYSGNTRAPLGFYMHSAWFYTSEFHYEGYINFIANITTLDDVWIVPIHSGIEYRKNPVTNEELINGALDAFNCGGFPQAPCAAGSQGQNCRYNDVVNEDLDLFEINMKICDVSCPPEYPWLGNPFGEVIP